jgi:xanthine/uracil/vitamin C permease (AzgA family)
MLAKNGTPVGILAFVMSLFRATDFLFRIAPSCIRVATIVGTGLLLALIGLHLSGIVVPDAINGLTFGDIGNQSMWYAIPIITIIASSFTLRYVLMILG